jgi:hypothetical protein
VSIAEARSIVGKKVWLTWLDRKGMEVTRAVMVMEATFVPLYGPCLITSEGDVALNKVVRFEDYQEVSAA